MEDVARRPVRFRWTAPLLYAALIFIGSSIPGRLQPKRSWFPQDKILHGLEYTGLGFLVTRAVGGVVPGVLLTALYGASDELHQRFTPGRDTSGYDWLADVAGAAIGATLWTFARRRQDQVHPGGSRDGDPA